MKYMGSKNRISKYLLPLILKDRHPKQWYVEPFCGGCNLVDKVKGKRFANDNNKYLIACFKQMQNNIDWIPKSYSKDLELLYKLIRDNKHDYPDYIVGYFAFALSYGGKFFGGWCRDKQRKRDYVKEAYNNAAKQQSLIQDIVFCSKNYWELIIPSNSIIYCDPPYKNTTKYSLKFDHDCFWNWCRKKSKINKIYISEYEAPKDFKCIWQKEIHSSLTQNTGSKKGVEKLFTI